MVIPAEGGLQKIWGCGVPLDQKTVQQHDPVGQTEFMGATGVCPEPIGEAHEGVEGGVYCFPQPTQCFREVLGIDEEVEVTREALEPLDLRERQAVCLQHFVGRYR